MQTICHYNTERLMQTVRIAVSHNFAPGELPPCKIMVHQKGTVYAQYPIDPAKTEQVIEPTTGKFPPGVCTLTLVDKNGHAYCERLLFARYPSKAHWQLRAQCTPDDLEKKVTVTIEPDKSGMLANGSFSMAMVQEGLDHTDSRYNFETYHYLGGELQGSAVPLDGLWTMNTTRDTQGIDLILLTRGWRRYSIEETARPHPDTDFPMEAGLSISGRVGGRVSKDDIPTVEVQTILRNGIHQDIYTCPIDSNKRFKLSGLSFDGIRDALISANTGSGKELPLELDKPEPPYRAAPDSSAVRLHRQEVDKWKEDSLAIASMKDPDIFDNVFVDEVKVTAKKADPLDGRRAYSKEFVQSSYSPPEGKVAGDLRSLLSRVPGVRMLPNKNTNGRYDPRRLAHISGFGRHIRHFRGRWAGVRQRKCRIGVQLGGSRH